MNHLVRLFWGIPALLLLGVLWVLSSTAGTQMVLDQASQRSNGLLNVGTVTDGHLLGRLQIDRLEVRTPAAEIDLTEVMLDWSPLALLRLRAQIDFLAATAVDVRLLSVDPVPEEEPEEPTQIPSRLPISLYLGQLSVAALTVLPAEGELMQINDILIGADWRGTRIRVRELTLDWVDQFPVALQAQARLSNEGVVLQQLSVAQPLPLNAEGHYDYDGAFAAAVDWTQLRWPINVNEPAQIESPVGTLQIEGRPEAYTVRLDAQANSPDYAGAVILEGAGGLEEIVLSTLDITALEGRAQASGRVRWAPALDVDIKASLANINPGVIVPEAAGRITGTLEAQGGLDADNPLRFSIDITDSELMDQPFALVAAGGWDQTREQLTLARARLSQGQTVVTAEGRAWPSLALNVRLESSDLSTLLPELRGSVALDATLTGNPTLPSVEASGQGQRLGWSDQISLAALTLEGSFDPQGDVAMRVEARQLTGVADVDRVLLRANGRIDDHRLQLEADAPQGKASLTLVGAADLDRQQWQGQLSQLRLAVPGAPVLVLREAADLLLSAAQTRLSPACLVGDGDDRIGACIDADVSPTATVANISLESLDYGLLTPFMPADMSLSGSVSGTINASLPTGGAPELEVDLQTREGAFEIRNRAALALLPGHIRATENKDGLRVDIDLPISDGEVRVKLEADPGADAMQRPLRGTVGVRLDDLDWLNRLTPEMEEMQGTLLVDLQLAGVIGEPDIDGRVALSVPRVSLPQAGVILLDTVAEVFPDGTQGARVAVRTRAGEGNIAIDGDLSWPEGQPQAELTIKGSDAQVADLPDARVWISPDMRIVMTDNQLQVSGRVDVPRADITPRGGSDSGQGPTADQIIVRDGEVIGGDPLMDVIVNVTVVLGDAVNFKGFGLTTRFAGQLTARQSPGQPVTGRGEIRLVDGRYKAYGQDLDVETGRIIFSGGPITDPSLDLRAVRRPRPDIEVGVTVRGQLDKPEFVLFSNPGMQQQAQLSWLVLGRGLQSGAGGDEAALANAALALGLSGSDFLAQRLKGGLIDDISIGSSPGEDADQARLTVGRYLTPELYISYGVGLFQPGHVFKLLYDIGRGFQLQTETGVATGADLLYTLER